MDVTLHPALVATLTRGAAFLDCVRAARQAIVNKRLVIPFPDGDGGVEFNGEGMVVDAVFSQDVFDRYPVAELADVLTAICQEAHDQLRHHADGVCSAVYPAHEPER